ncbi:vomeronasal type-1 receptor 4-like [Ctenodactylus gundi]
MILNIVKGTIFAFLSGLGSVGNISVFASHMLIFQGTEKKFIHLILIHLAFANIILLLFYGIPRTMAAFGIRNFLDDINCKIVVYLARVARGISICTSSLLTVVQAITMSLRHSKWRKLKPRSSWHILPLFPFFWILNSLIGINLVHSITSTSMNTSQISLSEIYCNFQPENQKTGLIFLALMVLRDAVFQGAMGGASGYVVFVLYKHHQHVLHLQKSKVLYRAPPEIKAAQSVLLLMLCFCFFYWADCVLSLYINSLLENNSVIFNIREFLALGYAVLSPFVLIHRDEHLTECWRAERRERHWENV